MDVKVFPCQLDGEIEAVSSKSMAHRLFICSALANEQTVIKLKSESKDILATVNCIKALGGTVNKNANNYTVYPINDLVKRSRIYDAVESGSTLRFMLPIICALGVGGTFIGEGRLPLRPMKELTDIIKGCIFSDDKLPITVSGKMQSGEYRIAGNVSSQYISGLIFALPLLDGNSKIILTTKLESSPYVDMTIDAVRKFGVEIEKTDYGFFVKGNQRYISPKSIEVEGDWSNSAFWLVSTAIGNKVKVNGLNNLSKQGDKKIVEIIKDYQQDDAIINCNEIPDLVPAISIMSALKNGRTKIVGAERLRLKESDRLMALRENLSILNVDVKESEDGLEIFGVGKVSGGEVEGYNDHRIVMSMAILATKASAPIVIKGAEAVAKSYPHFFEDFKKLGGNYIVL